jgi:hypothetical protein
MRWLVPVLVIATIVIAVPAVNAQITRPEIYWRIEKPGRPGDVAVVAFFLGTLESERPKPVPDAKYSAFVQTGGKSEPVSVNVVGGIAYAFVSIPLEMLTGGRAVLNVTASSEMYGLTLTRTITITVEPDWVALGVLATVAVPFLVPALFLLRRVRAR